MAVRGEIEYQGRVLPGSQLIRSTKRQTLGYEIPLECEDGRIKHVIWLTSSTIENAEKTFREALGVSREQLRDREFVTKKLAEYIVGRDVKFTTETDAQGYVKVKWLNGLGSMGTPAPADLLADFFSRETVVQTPASWAEPEQPKPTPQPAPVQRTIPDDLIPF